VNVCKRLGGAALALALLCGCGSPNHTSSVFIARADPPAPAAQKAKPLPAWAEKFNSASSFIGKPKKELYDAFGIPTSQIGGRYPGSGVNETVAYGYRGEFWNLVVEFDKDKKVIGCTLTFDQNKPERPSVANSGGYYKTPLVIGNDTVWEAVGAPGSKPESCYIQRVYVEDAGTYSGGKQSWDIVPSGMSGKSRSGQEIFLTLVGKPMGSNPKAGAYLTCTRKFNPDTNRFDNPTVTPNPGYKWKPRQVTVITTNPRGIGNEDYPGSRYIKYPVP